MLGIKYAEFESDRVNRPDAGVAGFSELPPGGCSHEGLETRQAAQIRPIYIRQGARTVVLKQGDIIFRTALSLGASRYGLYGISQTPGIMLFSVWLN